MRMKKIMRKIPRRKRYFCSKCQKEHGKAALKKWYAHRKYAVVTR